MFFNSDLKRFSFDYKVDEKGQIVYEVPKDKAFLAFNIRSNKLRTSDLEKYVSASFTAHITYTNKELEI